MDGALASRTCGDAARGRRFVAAGESGARSRWSWSRRAPDRTVLVQVTSLLTLPFAVGGTDMCAFVPARLARRCLDSSTWWSPRPPLDAVQITEAAHWHPRRETEPAVVWLRRLLYDVAVTVEDERDDAERGEV